MNPDRKPAKPAPKPTAKKPVRPMLTLKKKNYVIMGVGLATIVAGFISLAQGSITLAPLLLVIGYCVLIPLGLLLK
uniref:DUF3098 domain-containing protein n=1 Tax=candidate division WOR-3 bacterium TaxID=2052148 RepID=A0A7C4GIE9_UNCW3